jgi:hypothetical protein
VKILAGNPSGKAAKIAQSLGLGCMICTSREQHLASKRYLDFNFTAVDNGAFGCHKSGKPFNTELFLKNVERVNKINLNPLFIVCPDIVAGGLKSLDFSMSWLDKINYSKIALVVQDGMTQEDVRPIIKDFQYLFIGGSVSWKWRTAESWVNFAHDNDTPCHIGQAGQLWMLKAANRFGADSVDSTSWVVNKTWHIIREFQEPQQMELKLWD